MLGLAHRTQYWTRRVQKEAYRIGAFGFCGNEDVGQLSAWYVLSALGFAQVCPANEEYYIYDNPSLSDQEYDRYMQVYILFCYLFILFWFIEYYTFSGTEVDIFFVSVKPKFPPLESVGVDVHFAKIVLTWEAVAIACK